MENYIVSARKYRPATFATVVGQESITRTLKNSIASGHLGQAYLFCGPRGVGKTTCARIFAKTINCQNLTADIEPCGECESCKSFEASASFNIVELDAASNNSVDDIRMLIDQVRIPPQIGKYSVYIIDEVHMLSQAAFNAFLKTLEEPPRHAIFILATTEKHKILATILSRCQIFDFNRIKIDDIVGHLAQIAKKENVTIEPSALNIIAQKASGGLRDALSIFDQIVSFSGNNVTYQNTIDNLNVLDYEYYFKFTDYFLSSDYASALLTFDEILNKGFDERNFLLGLSSHFRDLLVCKVPKTIPLLEVSEQTKAHYAEQAKKCSPEFLFFALDLTQKFDEKYKESNNKRLHIELALLHLCNILKKKNDIGVTPQNPQPKDPQPSRPTTIAPQSTPQPTQKTDPNQNIMADIMSGKKSQPTSTVNITTTPNPTPTQTTSKEMPAPMPTVQRNVPQNHNITNKERFEALSEENPLLDKLKKQFDLNL